METRRREREEQLCLLAALLVAADVRLIIVGSLARCLDGANVHPHDLDILVVPSAANMRALSHALAGISARPISAHRFETSFGVLDVFCSKEPGGELPRFEIAGLEISFDPRPWAA